MVTGCLLMVNVTRNVLKLYCSIFITILFLFSYHSRKYNKGGIYIAHDHTYEGAYIIYS